MRVLFAAIVTLLLPLSGTAFAQAGSQAGLEQFLEQTVWPKARSAGVSRNTFDTILGDVRLNRSVPGLVEPGSGNVPQRIRQAEFSAPARYFNENNLGSIVSTGRSLARQHASTIAAIERQYGVPGRILLSVWGRESAFGRVDIPHDAFEVLATKAYMSTRPELFQGELVAALQMVERGLASPAQMKSSWAGALGQPQFLPSSYLEHAVDFDGDRRPDIWNSVPDTLASIAAYLNTFGWNRDRDWGFEVNVPDTISCALEGPDQGIIIRDWAALGVTRVSGRPFPADELDRDGYLLMPAGRSGPAFIVTENFYVIKEYNESDLYALFVGHAADRIEWNSGRFEGQWGSVDSLYRSDIAAMQRVLEGQGFDVGGADGLPGFRTRRSIGIWQERNEQTPTCFPSQSLVRSIR